MNSYVRILHNVPKFLTLVLNLVSIQ